MDEGVIALVTAMPVQQTLEVMVGAILQRAALRLSAAHPGDPASFGFSCLSVRIFALLRFPHLHGETA